MKSLIILFPLLLTPGLATAPLPDPALKDAATVYERPFPDRIRDLLKLPNGRVIREANYVVKNGRHILDGPTLVWSEAGALRNVQVWEQGKQAGVWLAYYASGSLASLDSFVDGESMERRQWFPNGRLMMEWSRKSDGWHFRNYDENGNITDEGIVPEKKK